MSESVSELVREFVCARERPYVSDDFFNFLQSKSFFRVYNQDSAIVHGIKASPRFSEQLYIISFEQ